MRCRLPRVALGVLTLSLLLTACDSGGPGSIDVSSFEAAFDCDVRAISTDANVSGSLTAGDCQLDDDSFIDYYAFEVDETSSVYIEHSSTQVDPFLFLFSPSGALLDQNDDVSEGSLNAAIERTLQAGVYAIGANSFDAGEVGAYSIRVSID